MYCTDITRLLHKLGVAQYEPKEWRLLIDSSKRLLKCVLLHNANQIDSVPLAHSSTSVQDNHDAVKYVQEKILYDVHEWLMCVDLKMVNILLRQKSGFTKYLCFLCTWRVGTEQNITQSEWPACEELMPCRTRNIIMDPLANRDRILFPPLHIKLGFIKQFIKALEKDGDCFEYLCQAFPGLTIEKLKAGVFHGPQIRQLNRDPEFENSMSKVEHEAWKTFVQVVKNFLGNNKARNYKEIINKMLIA